MAEKSDKELSAIVEDISGYDEDSRLIAARELEVRKKQYSATRSFSSTGSQKQNDKGQGLDNVDIYIPKKKPEAFVQVMREEEDLLLPYPKEDVYVLASAGKRFFNFIIDYVAAIAFMMFITANVSLAADLFEDRDIQELIMLFDGVIGAVWYFVYYIFLEFFVSGKTIGKMITRTRVVDEYGDKPRFKNIVGRTFARLIPFEFLSFMGEDAIGWHDSLSGTVVIDESKSVLRSEWL